MLAGLLAFRGSVPQEVADAFVPEAEAQRAARELATIGDSHPEIRTHILHANWHVPLRWFAAFDETERVLTEDNEGLRVRYATSIGTARTRVARALLVLQTSGLDEGVTESLAELGTWLESFVEEGILELDYGTVAGIFDTDDLVEDRSAAEVWCCIEALEAGDVVKAGRTFATLTDRWGEVRAREVVN